MKNDYFYHYYESERGPFNNLSSLNIEEAKDVLKKLKTEGQVFASQRQKDYMEIRRDLEKKARQIFIEKGGKPVFEYPHYMTLGACPWIKSWYKDGEEIKIHMDKFVEESISFTYGDLFPTMRYNDKKSYRGQVYTKQEIKKIIEEYGLPQEWNADGKNGPERYIEIQIWDTEVIKQYL